MREEPQQRPICVYCKKAITERIYKRLESGEKAHIACYVDNAGEEEKKPKS